MVKYCRWRKIKGNNVLMVWVSLNDLLRKLYYVFDPETDVLYTEEEKLRVFFAMQEIKRAYNYLDWYLAYLDKGGNLGEEIMKLYRLGRDQKIYKDTEDCVWV